jgi:ATP-dependent Clp protease protease subunit
MIRIDVDEKLKVKNVQDFIEMPQIIRVVNFDEPAVKEFRESFIKALNTRQPVIPIVIDSYGGQVYSLRAMVGLLKTSPVPIATIVEGKAMSCGSLLFSCGTEGLRFMCPQSTLMIHDVSKFAFGKVEELKADVKEADRLNQEVFTMMARNVGQPDKYFLDLIHEKGHAEWFLTPEEAKAHKLANHIRLPNFRVKLSADIKFE